jgi:hypothetical protein
VMAEREHYRKRDKLFYFLFWRFAHMHFFQEII